MITRPVGSTKYKAEYVKEADEYLQKNKDRTVKVLKIMNEAKGIKTYDNKLKVKLPTIFGFADYLGFSEQTLHNWAKDHPEFRQALDRIKNEQKQRVINMGLSGEYNSAIASLILSSNHGMVKRTDQTSAGESINTFNDEQVDRIAERLNRRKGIDGNSSS